MSLGSELLEITNQVKLRKDIINKHIAYFIDELKQILRDYARVIGSTWMSVNLSYLYDDKGLLNFKPEVQILFERIPRNIFNLLDNEGLYPVYPTYEERNKIGNDLAEYFTKNDVKTEYKGMNLLFDWSTPNSKGSNCITGSYCTTTYGTAALLNNYGATGETGETWATGATGATGVTMRTSGSTVLT